MNKKFVFLGTPKFAADILANLIGNKWRPSLVVTEPAKPVGRKKILTNSPVALTAKENHLVLAQPTTKEELTELLTKNNFEFGIVVAYGRILSKKATSATEHGLINVHGSILPKYRGASPVQAAILNGDSKTGISYMIIEPGLDTGPVITSHQIPIEPDDTTTTLLEKLTELTNTTIINDISTYLDGNLPPKPQDSQRATNTGLITKADGEVKLKSIKPVELDRKLRAYTPWPGIYTEEFTERLIIKEGYLRENEFVITKLQWAGKTPVDSDTFARSNSQILTQLPKTIRIDAIN